MIWADRVGVVVLIMSWLIAGALGAENQALLTATLIPVGLWAFLRSIDWIFTGEIRWIDRGHFPITLWDRRPPHLRH